MCLAIPGKVRKINGRQALVEYSRSSTLALIGEKSVKVGDYVLVQMGIIIKIITKKETAVIMAAVSTFPNGVCRF